MHRPVRGYGAFPFAVWAAAIMCLAAALASCSRRVEVKPPAGGVPMVRVLLSDKLGKAEVSIPGPYEVVLTGSGDEPRKLTAGDELSPRSVFCVGPDVVIAGVIRTQRAVELIPRNTPVAINGRLYRGLLRISANGGKLQVVNVLDLDGYLRGVVPSEVYPAWPPAALEAQAIAARTYALSKVRERSDQPFHLRPTTRDQAYGGIAKEDERTDAAVASTAGQVLKYRRRLFTAYYHAVCGGDTADARIVFADPAKPLRSSHCGYCDKAAKYKWSFRISRSKLAATLRLPGLTGLKLEGVGLLDGRIAQVRVIRAGKRDIVMAGSQFRGRVGTRQILSTRFKVRADGEDFVFDGGGWGHGVGMCQWGAKGMADAGSSTARILERYYPGAKIVKEY